MGAWGEKAFQNDSALDWLTELEAGGIDLLRATLSRVADGDEEDFIDVDDGAAVIAAAEVVAAALGHGRDRVTSEACAWLEKNQTAMASDDLALANRAVQRVLAPSSELRALWDENGSDNPWLADVRTLVRRLGADAGAARSIPTRGSTPKAPSHQEVGKREKQALVAFLSARGVTLTTQQMARIAQSGDMAEIRRWLARAANAPTAEALFDD